nr:hypothetical protein [Tanacetum cinerariifolium]
MQPYSQYPNKLPFDNFYLPNSLKRSTLSSTLPKREDQTIGHQVPYLDVAPRKFTLKKYARCRIRDARLMRHQPEL